jgi:serine/threonine-protein kinase HipA
MFNKKQVSHILPYDMSQANESDMEKFLENRKFLSISGVQEKMSLIMDKNRLRLTVAGERGTYILKPIPRDLNKVDQVPANEHVTMQIASQVYGINTAENGMIFFKNGAPAYITRRFDVKPDGMKWGKEDFASLAGKTRESAGPDFKYKYSYEEAAVLIRKYVPAWRVEIEKYFAQVIFNYLFSNGDAHLKNFSLLENEMGDYFLCPAYDLINTGMHVNDSDFGLDKGLFADNFESETYKKTGHSGKEDFVEFGKRIGVREDRVEMLLEPYQTAQAAVETLVDRSFLSPANKKAYLDEYRARLKRLKK